MKVDRIQFDNKEQALVVKALKETMKLDKDIIANMSQSNDKEYQEFLEAVVNMNNLHSGRKQLIEKLEDKEVLSIGDVWAVYHDLCHISEFFVFYIEHVKTDLDKFDFAIRSCDYAAEVLYSKFVIECIREGVGIEDFASELADFKDTTV